MRLLKLLAAAAFATTVYACDCREPSVDVRREKADVVFRGKIIALRDRTHPRTGLSEGWVRDTGKMAVFQVTRVWKGDVGQKFEMPAVTETSTCNGFWEDYLKLGADLLIYARRVENDFYTGICGNHKPAIDAKGNPAPDFKDLGPGAPPHPNPKK